MTRARYAAERAIHHVASSDTTDGLLMVLGWISLALWVIYTLGRHSAAERRTPTWLRERLKLPRRLTPIGVPGRRG